MNKTFFIFFLGVLVGCGKGEKISPNAFFAGEIVNPTSEYVVLYKGDVALDSAKLDKQNRFAITIDSVVEGLYHFNHEPELQYVYFEKGDSLMMRLNTLYFDESLVYWGRGEEINNFLLELFLANEEEAEIVRSYYKLETEDFVHKIDSLKQTRLDALAALKDGIDLSEKKEKIAKASVVYTYNTYKEKYPFKHKKYTGENVIDDLPESFYDYRANLTFDDSDLTYLRPYYNFMNNHMGNLSYMTCTHDCALKEGTARNPLHFNVHKLQLIDSLVKEKELKDNLFRHVAFNYLLSTNDVGENNSKFIERLHQLSDNNRHMQEIDVLYQGINNIQPDKKIPDVTVSDRDGNIISLPEIAGNNKTVFYFWSGTNRSHFDYMNQRISLLVDKNPDYRFVGINIRTPESVWKGLLETTDLDQEMQYRATDFGTLTKSLVINRLNKCIITDNGLIVDAFADVYGSF
ncbi:transaldolase [Pricia sp. S334]|uniref:Transaldolase n=1 Tax=Pricia mediterranea TaxID=3076079 RepID=A0ABU3LAU2_9FLAO|nr:transaldolase [Pricia sp. S334]MDT7830319.1 transaldolase [Pricia sp. S334]